MSPKVVSEILGHADVNITLNIYDHPNVEDFRAPLNWVASELLRSVTKSAPANRTVVDLKRFGAEART